MLVFPIVAWVFFLHNVEIIGKASAEKKARWFSRTVQATCGRLGEKKASKFGGLAKTNAFYVA